MASENRQSSAAIEQALLDDASAFSFSKVLSHLTHIVVGQGLDPSTQIQIRPSLSMKLTRSQVVAVNKRDDGIYEVITNFLGLYGASSPLPNFYTDDLINLEQEDQTTARRFLDVIHQRVYQLFAQAQQKYNSISSVVERQQQEFSQLLHTITGSRDEQIQKAMPQSNQLLSFIGLLSSRQRSAQGLEALLSGFLPSVDVHIEQCVERTVSVPEKHRSKVGISSCQLGSNALLGDRLSDRHSKIIVHLGPLSQTDFDSLVNDKVQWQTLEGLIKAYLTMPMEVDIKISLISDAAKGVALGESKWCQLGYDTWLLAPKSATEKTDSTTDILVSTLRLQ